MNAGTGSVVLGHLTYIGFAALLVNLVVSAALTVLFRRIGLRDGYDETKPSDYTADPDGSLRVIPPARVLAGLVTREEGPR
jgi:SSS family solute:Na+ symporter